jgi:hypothetical protein
MADMNKDYKKHFDDFLDFSQQERDRARKRRDYRDLKQWTAEEQQKLKDRQQAPIVFDQFGKKIDAFCGLEIAKRTDPKALPRTPKHEKAADVITQALRYVADNTHFDELATDVFEEKITEGYGACITEYNKDTGEIEINPIHWDRFYFDPHSREKDFSDARFMGISIWMSRDKAKERWKNLASNLETTAPEGLDFEDRPSNWIDNKNKRVRVNQEYFEEGGTWFEVWYSGDTILEDAEESIYLDEAGNPSCPIEAQSDYVDRDNNRYGYSQRLIDPQDEINHRRSKALYMLSSATLIAERGAFGDQPVSRVLDELRKAQGVIQPIKMDQVQIDRNLEMGQSQVSFYQDALNAMDSVGINPELTGASESAISGRAFIARQQSGMTETARVFSAHSNWKKRVYTQIWARIKQFWQDEKWVRVTDNNKSMSWVGMNIPVRRIDAMMEQQGLDIETLSEEIPNAEQMIEQQIQQNHLLGEVVGTKNNVVELDMDIIVEEVPDTASIQQEQFDTLANLMSAGVDPNMFKALLSLSTMPNKDEIIDMLEGDVEAQIQQQQQIAQTQQALVTADIENKQSQTAKNMADAQAKMADIPLKEAQTKDELASAIQRVNDTALNIGTV